ncbi:hypothetical protein L596_027156 [Steinernema carpocapsae]|uniref:Anaphase-promoting complex subunit 4 WD40 domain-containing protein n=1 Tax=Steinernema carpocapsae TaxID=34508 RepID=A0A4U5M3M2_STECR|nr:hypothetical protein L596_027156 [Steinernema carpocapsae]
MLGSYFLFIVAKESPRRLDLYNLKTEKVCKTIYMDMRILGVKHNPKRLLITTEDSIHLFDLESFQTLQKFPIYNLRIADLSQDEASVVAYPSSTQGEIRVFDAINLKHLKPLRIHQSSIARFSLSPDGSLLASASKKGTVIRVADVQKGEILYSFCRSLVKEAQIYSLVFSQDKEFLSSSSETGTLHLFHLARKRSKFLGNVIPSLEPLDRPKSVASCKLETCEEDTKIAFKTIDGELQVLVLSTNGKLEIFRVVREGVETRFHRISKTALFEQILEL